ncbi:hypothetical protein GY45DRAFT_1332829 [Cubamyces sp. BRFM 1775]|nr:hypothetical protein GY45DRAFT_1332829 [Cubamyces sp. BRFM 1775]
MKFSVAALSATLAALAGTSLADNGLTILSPGGPNLWWVAESDNVVTWTCQTSPYTNFTVLIANSNPTILPSPLAFLGQQANYDCSKLITKDQVNQPPATGYTIQLADVFNSSHIYAESEPFEIKNLGSAYPASSATPTGTGGSMSQTGSASGSQTASGAGATQSAQGDNSKNGAGSLAAPGGLAAAALAGLSLLFA